MKLTFKNEKIDKNFENKFDFDTYHEKIIDFSNNFDCYVLQKTLIAMSKNFKKKLKTNIKTKKCDAI